MIDFEMFRDELGYAVLNKEKISNVFPTIRKQIQDTELDVVGKMDDEGLRMLCESTAGVNLKEFVEDLKGAYDNCK